MSFVAQIQADIGNFEKNMKKAVDTTNESTGKMESKFAGLNKSLLKVGVGAAAIGAAVVAAGIGLVKLGISAGDATAKINNLSEATNLSTDVIQELSYVAKASNSSFEGLTAAMNSFQRTLKTADEEGSKTNETLAKLGVSTTDAAGNVRSMDDVLIDTFKSLGDMEKGLKRNAIGTELFRGAWSEVSLIVSSGSKGIEELRKEANQLGLVLDKNTLQSADDFSTAMGLVGFQIDTLKTKIGASLVPILENTILPLLQDKIIPAISKVVESIANGVQSIIKYWGRLVDYFTTGEGAEMWETIRKAAENLKTDLTSIFKDIEGELLPIWDGLGKELTKSFTQTSSSITGAINFIVETFDNFLNILRAANPKEALAPTKKFFVDFANGIKDGLSTSVQQGADAIEDLTTAQIKSMVGLNEFSSEIEDIGKTVDDTTTKIKGLGEAFAKGSLAELSAKITETFEKLNNETTKAGRVKYAAMIADLEKQKLKLEVEYKFPTLTTNNLDLGKPNTMSTVKTSDVWNVDNEELSKRMAVTAGVIKSNIEKLNEDLTENIVDFGGLISGAVTDFASIIGSAFGGDFSDFGVNLLDAVGSFAQQFGALLISAGIAATQLQTLITNPLLTIAAGAALVALGALTSKKAQSMTKNLTSGSGYSSAPSMRESQPVLGGSEYRGEYNTAPQRIELVATQDGLGATLELYNNRRLRTV